MPMGSVESWECRGHVGEGGDNRRSWLAGGLQARCQGCVLFTSKMCQAYFWS